MAFGDLLAQDGICADDYHRNHWHLDAGGPGAPPPVDTRPKEPWEPGSGPHQLSNDLLVKICVATVLGFAVFSTSMPVVAGVCAIRPPEPKLPEPAELTQAQKMALLYRGLFR